MNLSVKFDNTNGFLKATLTGVLGLANGKDAFIEVLKTCIENKSEKVLIDMSPAEFEKMVELTDRYEFAKFMAQKVTEYKQNAGLYPIRLVLFGTAEQIVPDGFGEIVGKNRGFEYKATSDYKKAYEWLERS